MPHPLIYTPFTEFNRRELTAKVSAKYLQHTSCFRLRECLPLLDNSRCFILGAEQQKVVPPSSSRWRDGAAEVVVDLVQQSLHPVLGRRREHHVPLLHRHTAGTQLLHLLDDGETAHHVVAHELAKSVEMDMAISLMPPSHCVLAVGKQAHWSLHRHPQLV
jgi:hypothetical protein